MLPACSGISASEAPAAEKAAAPPALNQPGTSDQTGRRRDPAAGPWRLGYVGRSTSATGLALHDDGSGLAFVTFFLFQWEDLRNRFIRLAGSGDIERTTAALDDAGQRLGKLFATQLFLNAVFGFIGAGLALIGVPSASLWDCWR
jgi:predicted PurR-regulated permease PerM